MRGARWLVVFAIAGVTGCASSDGTGQNGTSLSGGGQSSGGVAGERGGSSAAGSSAGAAAPGRAGSSARSGAPSVPVGGGGISGANGDSGGERGGAAGNAGVSGATGPGGGGTTANAGVGGAAQSGSGAGGMGQGGLPRGGHGNQGGAPADCASRRGGALVTLNICEQHLRIWVTNAAFIAEAKRLQAAGGARIACFPEVKEGRDCDEQWTWHADPMGAFWTDFELETYFACPAAVEEDKLDWVEQYGQFCGERSSVRAVDDRR